MLDPTLIDTLLSPEISTSLPDILTFWIDTFSLSEMFTFWPDILTSSLPVAVIFSSEVIEIAPEALIEPLPLLMVTA